MSRHLHPSPLRSPEPTLRHALRFATRAFHAEFNKRLARYGVSEAEYVVLFTVRRLPGLSSAEISRWSGVTPQGGNQVVLELERRGLIERRPERGHGRTLFTYLTQDGSAMIESCVREADEVEREMCSQMDASQQAMLLELLQKAADGLGYPLNEPGV